MAGRTAAIAVATSIDWRDCRAGDGDGVGRGALCRRVPGWGSGRMVGGFAVLGMVRVNMRPVAVVRRRCG